jgi:small subunit ribosomal protein S4
LREKQKAKRIYALSENQFHQYYQKASAKKGQSTSDAIMIMLELRLDNVLYRAGFADSRAQARQYISHGLFAVNGKTVTIPSYQLRLGYQFAIRDRAKASPIFTSKRDVKVQPPTWLEVDVTNLKGEIKRELVRDDLPAEVDAQLIVEYYSR